MAGKQQQASYAVRLSNLCVSARPVQHLLQYQKNKSELLIGLILRSIMWMTEYKLYIFIDPLHHLGAYLESK